VFHQTFIAAPHQHLNSCEGETSNVLCHHICQNWRKSDVDSQNSKDLLSNLKAQNFPQINRIKSYGVLTLYTTIPHNKLKSRTLDIIVKCFLNKCGKRKYSYLVISHQKHYFVKYHTDSMHKYSKVELKKMLEFLIDNIYVVVVGQVLNSLLEFPWILIVPLS
jgi:hypothetical protein